VSLADMAKKTADEAERLLADAQQHGHGAGDRGPAVSQGRCNSSHDEKSP
jgi:hypothetical protein